jgi:hypothetical protein
MSTEVTKPVVKAKKKQEKQLKVVLKVEDVEKCEHHHQKV